MDITTNNMLYYIPTGKRVFTSADHAWRWIFIFETESRVNSKTRKWTVYKVKDTPYYCLSTRQNNMPEDVRNAIQKIKAKKRQLKRNSKGELTTLKSRVGWFSTVTRWFRRGNI